MSSRSPQTPIGVCIFPEPAPNAGRASSQNGYVLEILAHAGICHEQLTPSELERRLDGVGVLLTVGEAALEDSQRAALGEWVAGGGAWLSIAGVCGLEQMLGVRLREPVIDLPWAAGTPALGEGYLVSADNAGPVTAHLAAPLHFYNGLAVQPDGAEVLATVLDAHQRETPYPAITLNRHREGVAVLIAPDVAGTVVHIQQGRCISRDGIPAPDGTAPVSDGVLKSDDGCVLDWIFDRDGVPGVPGYRAFLRAQADLWRETLIRCVLALAAERGVALPVLWYYPRNLDALAHISNDTDGSDPEKARILLRVLKEAGVRSTWCHILPGYPPDVIQAIRSAGHELGMHYDAMSAGTVWSQEEFARQIDAMTELVGEAPASNKNHYLRWEGDTEFFDWLRAKGILLDQSKGAAKTGEAGFNFGTCHPHFPADPAGRMIDVLELPTPTQDLNVFAPEPLVDALIPEALARSGILHLLFHPAHIDKPPVESALKTAVLKARRSGMEWWTAREISDWERARRALSWSRYERRERSASVQVSAAVRLPGATILWLGPEAGRSEYDGEPANGTQVEHWGHTFTAATMDIEAGRPHEIVWKEG